MSGDDPRRRYVPTAEMLRCGTAGMQDRSGSEEAAGNEVVEEREFQECRQVYTEVSPCFVHVHTCGRTFKQG